MPHKQISVQEFIARETISRWAEQLAHSGDERQRKTLRELFESERRHLRELTGESA